VQPAEFNAPQPPASPVVWTDINLVESARTCLSAGGIRLVVRTDGSLDGLEQAEGVIAGSLLWGDASFFSRFPKVQVFARSGIGYDRVDLEAATVAGVCVVNTPEAPTESTAEFAITLMLALARRLPLPARALAEGTWTEGATVIGSDLAGKTLGVVGCGRIGRRVAEIAQALRMEVRVFDPFAATLPTHTLRVSTLIELLASADVISLHLPLSSATHRMIGANELAQCKPGALLINTARGPLVDEAALTDALQQGRLRGAALDVWDPEPPAAESALCRLPMVIATPHMAAATHEGRCRSHTTAAEQVLDVLRGHQPPNLLNPSVWTVRRPPPQSGKVC